jgi:hypothetical protein
MKLITSILRPLASAAIFYYATLWLVVLVTVGTISQKYFGLQTSLEKYFSAWVIQPMDMPLWLPSGRLTMAIIMACLIAKLIVATKWKIKWIGSNIAHIGVLLLMSGGVITAYTTTEGNIAIQEGKEASTFQDFHKLELAVTDRSHSNHDDVTTFSDGFFTRDQTFTDTHTPLTFKIVHFYKNSKVVDRPASKVTPQYKGRASRIQLEELPPDNDDRNLAGLELEISGATESENGNYLFLNHPQWGTTTITGNDDKNYDVTLRHRHYQLPFSIHLKDFEKLDHAGTMMARAYSSKVTVTEGKSSEDIKIYMNHPLRRGGYTLYQSSFDQSNPSGIETSVFQVVHNKGRLMPYIAIVVITLGLLIHVFMQVPRLLRKAKTKTS